MASSQILLSIERLTELAGQLAEAAETWRSDLRQAELAEVAAQEALPEPKPGCALCWAEVEVLVPLLEVGDERADLQVGVDPARRVCPECASERPIILLPTFDTADTPVSFAHSEACLLNAAGEECEACDAEAGAQVESCPHLRDWLYVSGRFGPVVCQGCDTPVPSAELIARGLDPVRPHGEHQPNTLPVCQCPECGEFYTRWQAEVGKQLGVQFESDPFAAAASVGPEGCPWLESGTVRAHGHNPDGSCRL